LYQHFKSKGELIGVALVSLMDRISDYIATLPSTQPAIERIKLTCRKALILRFQDGFPDILSVKSLVKESLICQPAYAASANRLVLALAGLFDAAKKQGDVAPDIPTEVLVHAAIARIRDPELDPLIAEGRVQPEEIVELVVQMFLGGVVTDWQRSKMRRAPRF
jgi:AcrR family transcriptional regulator